MTTSMPMDTADNPRLHAQVWDLLPWLVNGRASDEQRALVMAHLPHCAGCRAELQAQQQLQQAVLQAPVNEPDAQAGLERLLGRIAAPAEPADSQPLPAAPRRSRLSTALAAAVVIQAVGLGLMSWQLQRDEGPFRTLSQTAPMVGGAPGGSSGSAPGVPGWRVVPGAGMAMADWQALLLSQGLRVVDGPNTVGAYLLAPTQADGARSTEVLAQLRATPGILLAEPLGAAP